MLICKHTFLFLLRAPWAREIVVLLLFCWVVRGGTLAALAGIGNGEAPST